MFENLITNKINPYTGNPLSKEYLIRLSEQQNSLKRLGVISRVSPNYVYSIFNIEEENNRIITSFISAAALNGVSENKLRSLTLEEQESALNYPFVQPLELKELSANHSYITFARAGYTILKKYNYLAPEFFAKISMYNTC